MRKKAAVFCILGLLSTTVGIIERHHLTRSLHPTKHSASPIGRWYMGTATGFDCNLVIEERQMTVQYGGCFFQEKPIVVAWKQQGDRVVFDNAVLKKTLGSYLSIQSCQGKHDKNLILVPENEQSVIRKYGYVYAHCFWKNMMVNGLAWPRDAESIGSGPPPSLMPPYK